MSEAKVHTIISGESALPEGQEILTLLLHSNSDNAYHEFHLSSQMTVAAFLEMALKRLSEGDGAERVAALKRYYQPILEIQESRGERELPPQLTLAEASVSNGAVCRIAARPLKKRIMGCSYG